MKIITEIEFRYIRPDDYREPLYNIPIQKVRLMVTTPVNENNIRKALKDEFGLNNAYIRYIKYSF